MKITPISNYNQKRNKNTKTSFNGKLSSSSYDYIKELKKDIAKKSTYPDTTAFQLLDDAVQVLENFAKKFHPDTEIKIHRGYEYEYHEDFDGECWKELVKNVYIDAKNSKLDSSETIGKIEIARNGSCDFCEHPSKEKFLETIKRVVTSTWNTPEKIDNEIYESSKNSFLKKVKENKKPAFITRFFTRREAKKLDKIAPEFHSTPDTLEQVNSHIDTWSKFYKEANK